MGRQTRYYILPEDYPAIDDYLAKQDIVMIPYPTQDDKEGVST